MGTISYNWIIVRKILHPIDAAVLSMLNHTNGAILLLNRFKCEIFDGNTLCRLNRRLMFQLFESAGKIVVSEPFDVYSSFLYLLYPKKVIFSTERNSMPTNRGSKFELRFKLLLANLMIKRNTPIWARTRPAGNWALDQYRSRNVTILKPVITEKKVIKASSIKQEYDFITILRLIPLKRADIFAEALTCIDWKKKIRWINLGRGPEEWKVKEILSNHKEISFLSTTTSNPFHYLARSRYFVHPASYESTGLAPIEALAQGIPAVICYVGGLTDLIKEDVKSHKNCFSMESLECNGFVFFKTLDELIDILNKLSEISYELARRAALNYYQENYSWAKLTADYSKMMNPWNGSCEKQVP